MAEADETRAYAAAQSEAGELLAERDAVLLETARAFRAQLASPQLTDEELRQAAAVAEEWEALATRRLEADARRAGLVAQILAAVAQPHAVRGPVLRSQLPELESLISSLRATVEMLNATAELAAKLR